MKDSYYFPHEYNATNDPKIQALLTYCGPVGLAIYWYIVELLYQDGKNELLAGDTTWAIISRVLNFPDGSNMLPHYDLPGPPLPPRNGLDMEIKMAVDTMEKVGLLTISKTGQIRSESVDRRLAERHEISEKGRENAYKRWHKDAAPMGRPCDPNAIKERKGKEIKEKKEALVANATKKVVSLLSQVIINDEITEWYEAFKKMRKQKRAPYTIEAELLTLEKLAKIDASQRVIALKNCVDKAWQGIEWGIKAIHNATNPSKQRGTGAVDYLRAQDGTA